MSKPPSFRCFPRVAGRRRFGTSPTRCGRRCRRPARSARRRADEARYQEVTVESAMTSRQGMPFKWALNPYRGCTHACEYCYARKYQRHLELGTGDDFSSVILVKRNLPEVLAPRSRAAGVDPRRRGRRHGDRSVPAHRRPLPADAAVPRGPDGVANAVLDRHEGTDGRARLDRARRGDEPGWVPGLLERAERGRRRVVAARARHGVAASAPSCGPGAR